MAHCRAAPCRKPGLASPRARATGARYGAIAMKQRAFAAILAFAATTAAAGAPLPPQARPGGDPYPSTYHAVPSAPVIIRNATVLTGTGERLEEADVLLQNGRVAAIGRNLEAPPEA